MEIFLSGMIDYPVTTKAISIEKVNHIKVQEYEELVNKKYMEYCQDLLKKYFNKKSKTDNELTVKLNCIDACMS